MTSELLYPGLFSTISTDFRSCALTVQCMQKQLFGEPRNQKNPEVQQLPSMCGGEMAWRKDSLILLPVAHTQVLIGRFCCTSLTTYTNRSCADVISRCVVLLPTSCYLFYTYATCGSQSTLHVQCKMYKFLTFRPLYTVWVKTCRETEIAHSKWGYT